MPSIWAAAAKLRLMVPESSAPGHGANEQRRAQPGAEEFGGEIDVREAGLGQRIVGQPIAFQSGRHTGIVDFAVAADVDVAALAISQVVRVDCHAGARLRRRLSSQIWVDSTVAKAHHIG